MGDFCEKNLAAAFAPELYYFHGDNLGREPHWVAGPLNANTARIGYLLSYYVDLGVDDPICGQNIPLITSKCDGHYGDSEDIFLDVGYNSSTQHWVLKAAYYSAHGNHNVYQSDAHIPFPWQLVYPSHPGAYPRSFVSIYKHANYASQGECEAGLLFELESCAPDANARVEAGAYENLGSREVQFLNRMASSNPLYANNGATECYWTGFRFGGWQGALPDSDPYSPNLSNFGF